MLKYYVSVINGSAYALLAGPFDGHQMAIDKVDAARDKAVEHDQMAWFYAFGTCSIDLSKWGDRPLPLGKLNKELGL
jgi:hypothetical protein